MHGCEGRIQSTRTSIVECERFGIEFYSIGRPSATCQNWAINLHMMNVLTANTETLSSSIRRYHFKWLIDHFPPRMRKFAVLSGSSVQGQFETNWDGTITAREVVVFACHKLLKFLTAIVSDSRVGVDAWYRGPLCWYHCHQRSVSQTSFYVYIRYSPQRTLLQAVMMIGWTTESLTMFTVTHVEGEECARLHCHNVSKIQMKENRLQLISLNQ
jgi:hypothetical protein